MGRCVTHNLHLGTHWTIYNVIVLWSHIYKLVGLEIIGVHIEENSLAPDGLGRAWERQVPQSVIKLWSRWSADWLSYLRGYGSIMVQNG